MKILQTENFPSISISHQMISLQVKNCDKSKTRKNFYRRSYQISFKKKKNQAHEELLITYQDFSFSSLSNAHC